MSKKYLTVIYEVKPGSFDAGDVLIDPNVKYFFWSEKVDINESCTVLVQADKWQIICSDNKE